MNEGLYKFDKSAVRPFCLAVFGGFERADKSEDEGSNITVYYYSVIAIGQDNDFSWEHFATQ